MALPTSYASILKNIGHPYTTRSSIDSVLSALDQKLAKNRNYGVGSGVDLAKSLSKNAAGVSFQEIESRLKDIYKKRGGTYAGGAKDDIGSYLADLQRQLAGLGGGGSGIVQAPSYDISGAFSKARKQAEKAVNPLYQKKLNDFLKKQAILRQRQKTDFTRGTADLDEALAETLGESELTRGRTAEDVARETGELVTQEQEFQSDAGTGFDQARSVLSGDVAQSGLTTSGLGQQQIQQATQERNTGEQRQLRSFNIQKEAQQTFKTRTFADLMRRDTSATKQTEKGKKEMKIDLDRYLEDLKLNEKETRQELEARRLSDIVGQQGNFAKIGFNKFLSTLNNPAQIEAAQRTYGGSF